MLLRSAAIGGCWIALLSAATVVAADNDLRVLARTNVELQLHDRADGRKTVRGSLHDDTGAALVEQDLTLQVGDCKAVVVKTDRDGRFERNLDDPTLADCLHPTAAEQLPLQVRYAGTERYGPAQQIQKFAPERANLDIELRLQPPRVRAGNEGVEVVLRATHRGAALSDLPIGVAIGQLTEQLVRTGGDGLAILQLSPKDLPAPGLHPVVATFEGDYRFNRTSRRDILTVAVVPEVMLTANVVGRRLNIVGRASSPQGPATGQLISLLFDDWPTWLLATDDQGAFALDMAAADLCDRAGGSEIEVVAWLHPSLLWQQSVASAPAVFVMPAQPTLPLVYYWLPSAVVIGLLLSLRVWRGMRGMRLRRRTRKPPARPKVAEWLATARVQWAEASGAREHCDIRAAVMDRHSGQALEGATVRFRSTAADESPPCDQTTDATGNVSFMALPCGPATLQIGCRGFRTLDVAITIPHRGELHGLRIELVSVRMVLATLWHAIIERWTAGKRHWGQDTPQETVPDLCTLQPQAETAIQTLAHHVECGYFGPPEGAEPALQQAEALLPQLDPAPAPRPHRRPTGLLAVLLLSIAGLCGAAADYELNSDEWNGLRYLFATAHEAQVNLKVVNRPDWSRIHPNQVFLLLYPRRPLPLDNLKHFLEDGGRLILADDFGKGDALLTAVGLARTDAPTNHPRYLADALPFPVFETKKAQGHFLTYNLQHVIANYPSGVQTRAQATGSTVIWAFGQSDIAFVLEREIGPGRLLVLTDASLLLNEMLRKSHGNKQFIANVLRYYCGDDWCQIMLVPPDALHTGRYRMRHPHIDGVRSFFSASVQTINGAAQDLNLWLQQGKVADVAMWIIMVLLAVGLVWFWFRRRRPTRFAWCSEPLPAASTHGDLARTLLNTRRRADFHEPLRWLRQRLDHLRPAGTSDPQYVTALRHRLAHVNGQRRVSAETFERLYDEVHGWLAQSQVAVGAQRGLPAPADKEVP